MKMLYIAVGGATLLSILLGAITTSVQVSELKTLTIKLQEKNSTLLAENTKLRANTESLSNSLRNSIAQSLTMESKKNQEIRGLQVSLADANKTAASLSKEKVALDKKLQASLIPDPSISSMIRRKWNEWKTS